MMFHRFSINPYPYYRVFDSSIELSTVVHLCFRCIVTHHTPPPLSRENGNRYQKFTYAILKSCSFKPLTGYKKCMVK